MEHRFLDYAAEEEPRFCGTYPRKASLLSAIRSPSFTPAQGASLFLRSDLQEDKEALFDLLDTARSSLRVFREMVRTARFRTERMAAACVGGFLEATDAAEYLVRKGLPFRRAHEVAAQVVRDCVADGQRSIADRTLEQLRIRSELFDADLFVAIAPRAAVAARSLPGGPAPQEVAKQIAELRKRLG